MTQLFGPPNTGGSFADKLAQARAFLDNARGAGAPDAAVEVDPAHGLAAEAPTEAAAAADVAPGAAAPTGVDPAVPVTTAAGHDPDGLAAAARAAAEQSIADPAYNAAATQNIDVVVQPRVLVQGQPGPVVVPVDVAVPMAHTNVTVAPAQAVVLDPATGQVVAASTAAPAAGGAAPSAAAQAAEAAAPTRGFRSMTAADIGNFFGGGGRTGAAPAAAAGGEAAPVVADAAAPAAAPRAGWRQQINDAIVAARGPAAEPAATVAGAPAEAAAPAAGGGGWRAKVEDALGLAKAPGRAAAEAAAPAADAVAQPSLLDRIRANTAGIGEVLTRTTPDAAPVADDVVKAAGRSGLMDELRRAAELAKAVNPKG
jgi:hypothetical protein